MQPRRTRRRVLASLLGALATVGALLPPQPAGAAAIADLRLDCHAETGFRTAGGRHSAGCIAYDGADQVPQVPVDIEASGANDLDGGYSPETPDFSCISPSFDPWCTWTHGPPGQGTTNDLGTTSYRAWIDVDGSNATVEADASETREEADGDGTDVVSIEWEPVFPEQLDCDDSTGPATEAETKPHLAGAASDEIYTCTLTNPDGMTPWRTTPVFAEVMPRGNDPDDPDARSFASKEYGCDVGASGSCTITITQADEEVGPSDVCFYVEVTTSGDSACGASTDTVAADGSDVADGPADWVRISWQAPGPVADRIDVEPESSSGAVGGSHTIAARVYDQSGSPFAGNTQLKLEFFAGSPSDPAGDGNSPETPDATCNTSGTSDCSVTYSQASVTGVDLVCAWAGPAPAMGGTSAGGTCEGEGHLDGEGGGSFFDALAPTDDVDVVKMTWEPPPPPAATIDCDDWQGPTDDEVNPASGSDTAQGYTCTLRDAAGALVKGDTAVKAEVLDGVNDPDPEDGASFGSPDYSCSTGTSGSCNVVVTQADGEAGTTRICFYVGSASSGESLCATEPYDEGVAGGSDAGNDLADAVRLAWEPRAASVLTVQPESTTGFLGTQHVFAARVWDQFGGVFSGNTQVKFERFAGSPSDFDGNTPETPDRTCTTVDFYQCSWGYTQANHPGRDVFCAWIGAAPAMTIENGHPRCDGEYVGSDTSARADAVERIWRRPVTYLDCDDAGEPTTEDETNAVGVSEVYTCKLTDSAGQPVVDERIGAVVTASTPSSWSSPSCRTKLDGTCTIQIGGWYAPVDVDVCFVHTENGYDPALCANEPYDEGSTGGADAANDLADRVRLTFADRTGALFVDVEPETAAAVLGADQKTTGWIYDEFGDPWVVWDGFGRMSFELFAGSPSDTDGNTPETPDRTCTTAWKESHCSITYTQAAVAGTDVFCAWSGAAPAMSGAGSEATCNGEGASDPDDDPGAIDRPYDSVDVFTKTWEVAPPPASRVDCDDAGGPATEDEANPFSNGNASNETYTCKVVDGNGAGVAGAVVRGEVIADVNDPDATDGASYGSPDYSCTTGAGGTCTITVTQAEEEVGQTTICFSAEEGTAFATVCASEPWWEQMAPDGSDIARDPADAVRLEWQYRVVTGLDVEPESASSPLGTNHVITAVVYDQFGERFKSWHTVKLERFAGSPSDYDGNTPETPDRSCSTSNDSQCSFGYTQGTYPGTDVFCAWVGGMANPVMTGSAAAPVCAGEGLVDPDDAPGVADAPDPRADAIDLVSKTWESSNPPVTLDCDDDGGPTEEETTPSLSGAASAVSYVCRLADASGNPIVPDSVVRAEVTEAVNDPDATDGASFESVDYFCNTGNDGTCDINVAQSESETGTTTVCFYYGAAEQGSALCAGEAHDEATSPDGSDSGNDLGDSARIEWQARVATGLDVEPETSSTPLGTNHVVTAVVYDQFGDRFVGNTPVKLEWFTGSPSDWNGNSPASPDRSCTTAAHSQCSFGYTQANHAGTDVFCAWIGPDPAMSGTSSAPSCDGEGLTDPDDAPGTADAPAPAGDAVDLVSKTWQTQ